jgi:TRAP-type C4-dicarboxylate transport system permease small subunit
MQKILEIIDRISTVIAVLLFVPMVLILTLNIVLRQFSSGISWYMESAQFLNIWAVFIAFAGVCATNDHLRVDAIEGALKGTPKRIIRLVISVLTVIFLVVLGYSFVMLASRSRQTVSTMPAVKFAVIYWPIPILCFFSAISCSLHAIWDFVNFTKGESIKIFSGESEP